VEAKALVVEYSIAFSLHKIQSILYGLNMLDLIQ